MRQCPCVVVTGTGTGIGKTHVTCALIEAWAAVLRGEGAGDRIAGIKPVETGVAAGVESDGQTLEHVSTFHVKRRSAPYMLARAVSPHLAAASAGIAIELGAIREYVSAVRADADGVAVELAGGLFSPLGAGLSNADLAQALEAEALVLVAPDRLGVLHDVASATRAAAAMRLGITGIILVAPEHGDTSTGTNAAELAIVTDRPVLASLPRGLVSDLAARPDVQAFVRSRLRPARARPL